MKCFRFLPALIVSSLLITSLSLQAQQQELPEVTEDGLHLVPDSNLAIVYAEPGADLGVYQQVRLMDAYVAFKKNWESNQRSRSATQTEADQRVVPPAGMLMTNRSWHFPQRTPCFM